MGPNWRAAGPLDIRAVVDGRHLRVIHQPKPVRGQADEARPDPAGERAEVLPGSIGYADVRVPCDPAGNEALHGIAFLGKRAVQRCGRRTLS